MRRISTKPTANKHPTKQLREAHLAQVARLYLTGHLQTEIAEITGVDQSQISRDLKALHTRWKESALIDFNEAKQRELEKIDLLEVEYWSTWRESKNPRRRQSVVQQRRAGDADTPGEIVQSRIDNENQFGDPRYLAGVQWCVEQRCKILELGVKTNVNVQFGKMTDAELLAYIAQRTGNTSSSDSGSRTASNSMETH